MLSTVFQYMKKNELTPTFLKQRQDFAGGATERSKPTLGLEYFLRIC
jgi:hypothetical protein